MSTIAAISTAKGIGGIGVIRISGDDAIKIASKVFVPFNNSTKVMDMKGYTAKYGKVTKNGEVIDEAVLLIFRAPYSYTGEDVAEISCHGGLFVTREVLRAVLDEGAVLAGPGEFTKRAFLNGKVDLSQAESVMDIISARGKRANRIAQSQRDGVLSKKINAIKEKLLEISASLSVWADFPEEDIPEVDSEKLAGDLKEAKSEISKLIKNYDKVLTDGVKTVIVGRPNVGKSTLMNLISGVEKSIVTDIAGTTRDMVEETVMVGDIPLLLVDTAGIRETDDVVEKIGVGRAKKSINDSDLNILILDASQPLTAEDLEIMKLCDASKTIVVLNKIDLGMKINPGDLSSFSGRIVEMSALNYEGEEEFRAMLQKVVAVSEVEPSEALISNERQFTAMKRAFEMLDSAAEDLKSGITLDAVTVLIQNAVSELMSLTGENVNIETVNKIFSKFCVGK
mgnify:FL=1